MANPRTFAAVSMTGRDQTADSINQIVKLVLGRAGCHTCGRIARLQVDFLTDPPPDLARLGAHSFDHEGLKG